jgi:biopolymer transport protein ExbD
MATSLETDVHSQDEQFVPTVGLRRPRDENVDMDITPMIDMTFLLLIFFLVSSTPDQQTAIELPKAHHGRGVSQRNSVVLTIGFGGVGGAPVYAADGRIAGTELADDAATRERQVRELIEKGFRENKTNVVIKADKSVAYREVARVVEAASGVEGVQIHLAVLETQ